MKYIFMLMALMGSFFVTCAQDSNILISLASPVFGVKIKANFPSDNGNWARGYYLVNENNTKNFFGFGALGGNNGGVANFDHGWIGQDYDNTYMNFLANGNVGIGTTTPADKLSVNGRIRAREVKVETQNWPDYVFKPLYKLPSLTEVETFIHQNHHLPDMPSENDVIKDGFNLGEMNKILLKKVEELTLYLIEKDKKEREYESRFATQQQSIDELRTTIKAMRR